MARYLRCLAIALAAGLWAGSKGEAETVFPGKDWQEASPESQAVDSAKLKVAVDYMDAHFGGQGAEELVIVRNQQPVAKLVGEPAVKRRPRQPGSARQSILHMAGDFDAPLEDFKEYME